MCDTQCFHVTDHHPYRFFRGHFLEIKTLNTSTQWFFFNMFLFSTPWGNDPIWRIILQMAGSTTTYRCVFLTPPVTSHLWGVQPEGPSLHADPPGSDWSPEGPRVEARPMEMLLWDVGSCCEVFSEKKPGRMKNQRRKWVYLIYCKIRISNVKTGRWSNFNSRS